MCKAKQRRQAQPSVPAPTPAPVIEPVAEPVVADCLVQPEAEHLIEVDTNPSTVLVAVYQAERWWLGIYPCQDVALMACKACLNARKRRAERLRLRQERIARQRAEGHQPVQIIVPKQNQTNAAD